jgi:hypothetical protein
MYDPDGYSLLFCDYKFQVLPGQGCWVPAEDGYAFGKMPVIGSETPLKLKGL